MFIFYEFIPNNKTLFLNIEDVVTELSAHLDIKLYLDVYDEGTPRRVYEIYNTEFFSNKISFSLDNSEISYSACSLISTFLNEAFYYVIAKKIIDNGGGKIIHFTDPDIKCMLEKQEDLKKVFDYFNAPRSYELASKTYREAKDMPSFVARVEYRYEDDVYKVTEGNPPYDFWYYE